MSLSATASPVRLADHGPAKALPRNRIRGLGMRIPWPRSAKAWELKSRITRRARTTGKVQAASIFRFSSLAGRVTISSTGTGVVTFPVVALAGDGYTPSEGSGSIEFAVTALAGFGEVPYSGSADPSFAVSALAATGLIDSTDTGEVVFAISALAGSGTLTLFATDSVVGLSFEGQSELADTSRGFKHYEQFSSVNRVLVM